MYIIIHNNFKIKTVIKEGKDINFPLNRNQNIVLSLFEIAENFQNEMLVWVHESLYEYLELNYFKNKNEHEIFSFNSSNKNFIIDDIEFVDFKSVFLNVKKDVKYATWLLSSNVGCIYSNTLLLFNELKGIKTFDLFLSHLGFLSLKFGFLVYSDNRILKKSFPVIKIDQSNNNSLFNFIRKNYTIKQYFFFLIAILIFKKKLLLLPFLKNLIIKKYSLKINTIKNNQRLENIINVNKFSYDVVIPSIGRSKYLKDVLYDLNNQTTIPKNVIIIEQKLENNSESELTYLNQIWKFNIIHKLINQQGACNARNIAINEIDNKTEWVFFADDDIRIEADTIRDVVNYLINYNIDACSIATYKEGEYINKDKNPSFWSEFSSGASIVKSNWVKNTLFDMKYEFGFGEDTDYGCQLRKKGCSILYYNRKPIYHLKAPIGGFRNKVIKVWDNLKIKPYPDPTVTKCQRNNYSEKQFKGFKLFYILKNFKILNPLLSYKKLKLSEYYSIDN